MWKYAFGLAMNLIGPVTELIQAKKTKALKQIRLYCDQHEAGDLTSDQAMKFIKDTLS